VSFPSDSVRDNIRPLGFRTVTFKDGAFSTHVSNLLPGQVEQFFVAGEIGDRLTVRITNISPENPPASQNQLFGDDLQVTILDAPTSGSAALLPPAFIDADTSFLVTTSGGLVRLAIQGDWTNGGRISADVSITRERGDRGKKPGWSVKFPGLDRE
jgi:hypothetical protein